MNNTSDYIEITQLLNTFGTSIDQREWDTYETLFADEVDFDYSAIEGPKGVFTAEGDSGEVLRNGLVRSLRLSMPSRTISLALKGTKQAVGLMLGQCTFSPNPQGEALLEIGGHYAGTLVRVRKHVEDKVMEV